MRTQQRILSGMTLINFVGAFIIFFYFAYIDLETLNANKAFWRGSQLDWSTFAVVMALLGIVGGGIVWGRYGRILDQWSKRLSRPDMTFDVPINVLRWAASYPLLVSMISLALWIVAGAFFAQGGIMFGMSDSRTFWRTFLGIVGVGGVTASALIYLTVDLIWRRELPRFLPDGALQKLRTVRVSVAMRLAATFTLTGLVPLIVLGTAARNSLLDTAINQLQPQEVISSLQTTIIFIALVGLASNILLSWLSARSLIGPLNQLTHGMTQVGNGNFDVQIPVATDDELGDATHHFNQMVASLKQSQRMRDLFGRYVSREVAEQVLRNEHALGGVNIAATALFADIRDFTTLSEQNSPEVVVDILNRYYSKMVDVIIAEGGMVNKFGGDSLLAVFGAPIRQTDHALRAVRAAEQMQRALAEFNAEQIARGLPHLTIGVGVSSGDMVAGNIGGQERMEYTVIGDPVNLAARLESLTKQFKRPVLISEHTRQLLEDQTQLEPCSEVIVKGKSVPTMVYALA